MKRREQHAETVRRVAVSVWRQAERDLWRKARQAQRAGRRALAEGYAKAAERARGRWQEAMG